MTITAAVPSSRYMAWTTGRTLLLIIAVTAAANLAIHWYELINNDVAFLAWASREMLGPPVYGVDLYEVNPPLCFLIYTPAAWLAPYVGLDPAIKLWVTFLGCMSLAGVWNATEKDLRLPVTIALALFFIVGSEKQLGQREQIAFLLCAPYVAGPCERRGWSILNGVMAGVGFAIKPYFLLPLLLVFATRRRIRTEEWAIAATGLAYALVLAIYFQPYVLQFLPEAAGTYGAYHSDRTNMLVPAALIAVSSLPLALAAAPQAASYGYLAAMIGFLLAALMQFKGFGYHFTPALGFLVLYLTVMLFNPRRFARIVALLLLINTTVTLCLPAYKLMKTEPARKGYMTELLGEVDKSSSFLSLSTLSYPAFPTALYTQSRYVGLGIGEIFLPAALKDSPDGPDRSKNAVRLALRQAIRELQSKPEIVFLPKVATGTRKVDDGPADLLDWYGRDSEFAALWRDYEFVKLVGDFRMFRRKPSAAGTVPGAASPL